MCGQTSYQLPQTAGGLQPATRHYKKVNAFGLLISDLLEIKQLGAPFTRANRSTEFEFNDISEEVN